MHMKCPACQIKLKEDAKFCFQCGRKIPRCPTCGEPVLTRSKFCGKDGTALPQEVLDLLLASSPAAPAGAKPAAPVAPSPRPVEQKREAWTGYETVPVAETNQNPSGKSYCAKCGKAVAEGRQLCSSCKTKARESHAAPYERREEKQSKGNSLIILLVVVTVLVCVATAAVCIAAFSGKTKAEENETVAPPNSGWFEYYDEELGVHVLGTEPEDLEVSVNEAPAERPTEAPTVAPAEPPTEPPTEAPTEPEIDADPRLLYFIENCDSMYLKEDDVQGFDKEMCRIARNSLYAKSGRMFKDSALQEFFEQFDWYDPRISPSDFTGDMLNQYQSANLNVISEYERERGYR